MLLALNQGGDNDRWQDNMKSVWPLNTWHLETIVYDSVARTVKFYFDGVLVNTGTYTTAATAIFQANAYIGSGSGNVNDRSFHGKIDDFRIFGIAAGDADVAALYASYPALVTHTITATAGANATISPSGAVSVLDGEAQTFSISAPLGYNITAVLVDGVAQGLPLDSYTFSDVTADHTIAVSSTKMPTYHIRGTVTGLPAGRTAIVSATAPGGSFTASTALDGTYSIEVADTYTYTVSAWAFPLADLAPQSVPVSGTDVTGIHFALTDATLLWLKFDGDVLDSSGRANDGSLLGAAVISGGGRVGGGGCLSTVNGNGGVVVANELSGMIDSYTMSAWMRVTIPNDWATLWMPQNWGYNVVGNLFRNRPEAVPQYRGMMATTGGTADVFSNNHWSSWALGDWHFITIVYDSVALTTKFYFDGMPDGAVAHTAVYQAMFPANGRIGCWSNPNDRPFRGEIDDFRIVATAAQDGDVAALYASYPIQILPLSGFTMPGGLPTFVVPTVSGYQYRLVYKDNLTDGAWMQGPWTPGTGGDVTLSDSTATGQPHRFYRLEVQ